MLLTRTISFALVWAQLLCACVSTSTLKTNVEYDYYSDFSQLSRYHWMSTQAAVDDSLIKQLMIQEIVTQLATQGYQLTLENPDFLVSYELVVAAKSEVTVMNDVYQYPMGWGYGRRYTLGARNRPRKFVYQYAEGTLIIDIINAKTNKLMWRGTASDEVEAGKTQQQKQQKVKQAVREILRQFPPR